VYVCIPCDRLVLHVVGGQVEVQIGTHLDTDSEQSQLARRQAVLQTLAPSLDVVAGLLSVGVGTRPPPPPPRPRFSFPPSSTQPSTHSPLSLGGGVDGGVVPKASEPDVEAALEFFESVSLAVRVPQLGQIPGVQWLMGNVRSVTDPLSPPLHSRLYTGLACILLLPYKLPSSTLTLKAKQVPAPEAQHSTTHSTTHTTHTTHTTRHNSTARTRTTGLFLCGPPPVTASRTSSTGANARRRSRL
jgi:hypothetical protein